MSPVDSPKMELPDPITDPEWGTLDVGAVVPHSQQRQKWDRLFGGTAG